MRRSQRRQGSSSRWPAVVQAVRPSPRDRVLPDFDSRTGQGRGLAPLSGRAGTDSLDLLRTRLSSPLQARTHPVTGYVRLLWAGGEALSEAGADTLLTTRRFLQENAPLLGLDPAGVGDLVPARTLRWRRREADPLRAGRGRVAGVRG
jgi:hypothetical protein